MHVRAAVAGLVLALAAGCGGFGGDGAAPPGVLPGSPATPSSGPSTGSSTGSSTASSTGPTPDGADGPDGRPGRDSATRAAAQAVEALLDDGRSATAEVLAVGLSGYGSGKATALVFVRVTTAATAGTSTALNALQVLLLQEGDGWRVGGTGADAVDDVPEPDGARVEAMTVAADFVTALTTFEAPGYVGYQDRLRPLVTADYGRTVSTSVAQLKATGTVAASRGSVDGVGVQRIGRGRARVLVSAAQAFRTSSEQVQQNQGEQVQQNRMVVHLHRDGGSWRVAGVETLS